MLQPSGVDLSDELVNIDAEQALLGTLIVNTPAAPTVVDAIRPEDFWMPQHQIIFAAMMALVADDKPTDIITLSDALKASGQLEDAGGLGYLAALPQVTPTTLYPRYYAEIVVRWSVERQLIALGEALSGGGASEDLSARLEQTEERLGRMRNVVTPRILEDKAGVLDALYAKWLHQEADDAVIATGLLEIDNALEGGFRRGDLIILGARPGLGKSALAATIAHHIAIHGEKPAVMYSAEMSVSSIYERMTSIHTGIALTALRRSRISAPQVGMLDEARQVLREAPLEIVEASSYSIERLSADLTQRFDPGALGLIVLDYLQLFTCEGYSQRNRNEEVGHLSRMAKRIALRMKAPVLALAQLNRESEKRPGKVPTLAELRESGSLEQDADQALLLFDAPTDTVTVGLPHEISKKIIDIAKNRNGEQGRITLGYRGIYTQFVDLHRREEEPF